MNLKDARKAGALEKFIAEREKDQPPGDERKLEAVIRRAASERPSKAPRSSGPAGDASCGDTQTRPRTSRGASGKPKRGFP